MLLAAARCGEERRDRVVGAVGEELEREERVRRAALAQVDLDGVRRPSAARLAHDDEVDREAPEDAFAREPLADLRRLDGDQPGVREVGGEHGSRGSSARSGRRGAGRASRGSRPRRAASRGAGRSGCAAPTPVMRSSTMPPPAASVRRYSATSVLRLSSSSCSDAGAQGRRLVGGAGSGQPAQVDDRVAPARHAVVVLDDRLRDRGLRRAHPLQRLDHAVDVGDVLPARAGGPRRPRRTAAGSPSWSRSPGTADPRRTAGSRARARGRAPPPTS